MTEPEDKRLEQLAVAIGNALEPLRNFLAPVREQNDTALDKIFEQVESALLNVCDAAYFKGYREGMTDQQTIERLVGNEPRQDNR
jgi:hypothetical protein